MCETVVSVGSVSRWSVDDFSRWFQFVVSVGSQSVGSVDEYIRAINLLCFVELTVGASFLGEALGCHAEQDKLRHFMNEHLICGCEYSEKLSVWKLDPFFGCIFCFPPDAADSCNCRCIQRCGVFHTIIYFTTNQALSDSSPTQPAFGWRSLTLFRHQTRANLDVALLVPWGKLAAILGSRGLVVGQDSLPFFGRETLTAFRQHDRIEDSQPKNGSRFLTEKRMQIRYRKMASFAAGRGNRISKSWQRFAAQRLNISNRNLAEAGRDTIHLTLI